MSRRRLAASAFALGALATLALVVSTPTGRASTDGAARAPRTLTDAPVPHAGAPLRVLVYHDMEGVSGQDDFRTFLFAYTEQYNHGRELLTADINAVVDGLFAGGATKVDVLDAHGSSNPEPDVRRDLLDKRAGQYTRDEPFDDYDGAAIPNAYDAIAVVAMHAKTGSKGFASHTKTIGMDIIFNGMSVTESEIVGYSWGRFNVPVIFASGDDRLQNDLKVMPWIEYVVTKTATSASTVKLRPVDLVHTEMREKASRALRNLSKAKVMKLTSPVKSALHVQAPASLASLDGVPGITLIDGNKVEFTAPDFITGYRGVSALIRVATSGYQSVMQEQIAKLPDPKAFRRDYIGAVIMRMMDVESGRWTAPPTPKPPAGTKYYGAR